MKASKNIQKLQFIKQIDRELQALDIGYYDIYSVVQILIEELIQELRSTHQLRLPHFGTFHLKTLNAKTIKNVATGKLTITQPTNVLRFKLARSLVRLLKTK